MAESPSDVFTKISNKEASAGQWMIVSFDAKKKLAVDATGEGFESLNKALDDAKCAWVCFNVHGVDVRENVQSVRTKLVQYNWVGDKVPSMKKMQALSGKPKVAKLFKGIACTFDINSKEDISAKEIVSKLCASGGAHKPTYYAFGNDEKIDLEFYAAENK